MRALISAVRAVVALPARATTTLADWRDAHREDRDLWRCSEDITDLREWWSELRKPVKGEPRRRHRQRKPQTRKEAA